MKWLWEWFILIVLLVIIWIARGFYEVWRWIRRLINKVWVIILLLILIGCISKPLIKPVKLLESRWNEWPYPQQKEWQESRKKGIPYES